MAGRKVGSEQRRVQATRHARGLVALYEIADKAVNELFINDGSEQYRAIVAVVYRELVATTPVVTQYGVRQEGWDEEDEASELGKPSRVQP